MLEWTRKVFPGYFSFFLWTYVISCAIGGIMIFKEAGWNILLGFISGILSGLGTAIILGGLVATFLNMNENLEEIRSHLEDLSQNKEKTPKPSTQREIFSDLDNKAGGNFL